MQTENMTTSYSAFARFEEPKDPNGVIVAYDLEYHRLDGEFVSILKNWRKSLCQFLYLFSILTIIDIT